MSKNFISEKNSGHLIAHKTICSVLYYGQITDFINNAKQFNEPRKFVVAISINEWFSYDVVYHINFVLFTCFSNVCFKCIVFHETFH